MKDIQTKTYFAEAQPIWISALFFVPPPPGAVLADCAEGPAPAAPTPSGVILTELKMIVSSLKIP